jgi:hypothetical protein
MRDADWDACKARARVAGRPGATSAPSRDDAHDERRDEDGTIHSRDRIDLVPVGEVP